MDKKEFLTLSFIWGFPLTLISIPVFIFMLFIAGAPKRYGNCLYFECGRYWGGIEFGWFFIVNKNPSEHILNHEYGHGIQNCKFGPLFIFLWLFGIARYWIRNLIHELFPSIKLKPYDSAWNEQNATDLGALYIENYKLLYPDEQ